MKATVNIIKDIVNSLVATVVIDLADNNGNGTFTIYSENTYWISKSDTITIGVDDYFVNEISQNVSFTITPTGTGVLPAVTNFSLPVPTYIHGTLKMSKNEVNAIKNKMGLVPFVYLYEVLRDKKNTNESSAIDRETTLRIFFLNSSSFKDMLTEDVYAEILNPLQTMFDLFISKIKSSKYFTENMDYENIPLVNFSEEGNQQKSIFDCNLSGIELRLSAEIRKDLGCGDYTPPASCLPVTITDGLEIIEIASGGVYSCLNIPMPCAEASYIVKYLNGTLIESGTIPSGGSKIIIITNPIVCSDATYTILDEDLNVLYTGSIVSGGDLQQTILNAVVQNSDLSYDTTVPAQGILPLPNVRIKKSDGISSIAVIPSVQNYNVADSVVSNTDLSYSANVMATDSLVLPDTTYNINLDGVLNQTFAIPTLKNETINISL